MKWSLLIFSFLILCSAPLILCSLFILSPAPHASRTFSLVMIFDIYVNIYLCISFPMTWKKSIKAAVITRLDLHCWMWFCDFSPWGLEMVQMVDYRRIGLSSEIGCLLRVYIKLGLRLLTSWQGYRVYIKCVIFVPLAGLDWTVICFVRMGQNLLEDHFRRSVLWRLWCRNDKLHL